MIEDVVQVVVMEQSDRAQDESRIEQRGDERVCCEMSASHSAQSREAQVRIKTCN